VSKGIALAEYAAWLDERALFLGQWGLRGSRSGDGPTYDELVETEGRPRLRSLLAQVQTDGIVQAAVVHGYFPAVSKDEDLIILDPDSGYERCRFTFPRQRRDRRLCLADFFRSQEGAEPDVVAFQVVTMGAHVSQVTGELFARNAYREYLELHGLSVQLTEALAELWHARIRAELGFGHEDDPDLHRMLTKRAYRGSRYSFGYPACPAVEDQERCRTCWSGSASASTCRRSRCWCPSSRRRRWSCTTRRRSTSPRGEAVSGARRCRQSRPDKVRSAQVSR
jgi:5-methyltetrahydrofolate--homocysteine methyltransferase